MAKFEHEHDILLRRIPLDTVLEGQARHRRVVRFMSDHCHMILRCAEGLSNKAVASSPLSAIFVRIWMPQDSRKIFKCDNPDKASLWRWTRPQIVWHIANFEAQKTLKHRVMRRHVGDPKPILTLSPPE